MAKVCQDASKGLAKLLPD